MEQEIKIICTLGPASSTPVILNKMVKAGMSIVRLNFSHGNHKSHKEMIEIVKSLNNKYGYNIKILQGLEGYRIRIGHLSNPVEIKRNEFIRLSISQKNLFEKLIPFDYKGPLENYHKKIVLILILVYQTMWILLPSLL